MIFTRTPLFGTERSTGDTESCVPYTIRDLFLVKDPLTYVLSRYLLTFFSSCTLSASPRSLQVLVQRTDIQEKMK